MLCRSLQQLTDCRTGICVETGAFDGRLVARLILFLRSQCQEHLARSLPAWSNPVPRDRITTPPFGGRIASRIVAPSIQHANTNQTKYIGVWTMMLDMFGTWIHRMWNVGILASFLLMLITPVSAKQLEVAHRDATSGATWAIPSLADRTKRSDALRYSQSRCPRGRLMCTNARFQQWCIPAHCSCGQYPGTWVCQRMF